MRTRAQVVALGLALAVVAAAPAVAQVDTEPSDGSLTDWRTPFTPSEIAVDAWRAGAVHRGPPAGPVDDDCAGWAQLGRPGSRVCPVCDGRFLRAEPTGTGQRREGCKHEHRG